MRSGGIIQHKLERHDTFTASGPHVVIVRQSGVVTGTPCRSLRIHQLLRVELEHVPLFEVNRIERIPFSDKIAPVLGGAEKIMTVGRSRIRIEQRPEPPLQTSYCVINYCHKYWVTRLVDKFLRYE